MTIRNKDIRTAYENIYELDAEDSLEYLNVAFEVLCDNGILSVEDLYKTRAIAEKAERSIKGNS